MGLLELNKKLLSIRLIEGYVKIKFYFYLFLESSKKFLKSTHTPFSVCVLKINFEKFGTRILIYFKKNNKYIFDEKLLN